MSATTNIVPADSPLADSINNKDSKTTKVESVITFTASEGILHTFGKSLDYEQELKNEAMMCRVYKDTYELFGGRLIWPEYPDMLMLESEFEEFISGYSKFLENMEEDVIENHISTLLPNAEYLDTDAALAIMYQGHTSLVEREYNEDTEFSVNSLASLIPWLKNRGENVDLWIELLLAVYGFSSLKELERNYEMVETRASAVKKSVENSDLHRRSRAYHHNVLSQKRAKMFKISKKRSHSKSMYMTEIALTGAAAIFTVWLVSKFLKNH